MAVEDHIEALKKKHATLDRQLREESIRAGADQFTINHLKLKKLSVKDEIEKILQNQRAVA
jgi:hypothetical protein